MTGSGVHEQLMEFSATCLQSFIIIIIEFLTQLLLQEELLPRNDGLANNYKHSVSSLQYNL